MKRRKKAIPIAFNMSLGLIPVILCMILTEFIENKYALSICSVLGLIFTYVSYFIYHKKIYNFILYISTFTLVLLAILSFIFSDFLSTHFIASIMAITTIILTGFFFYGQNIIQNFLLKIKDPIKIDLIKKSFESNIVSARLIFIMGIIHLSIVLITLIVPGPSSVKNVYIIFHILPILFFILIIVINQLAIYYANRITKNEIEIPIVNEQGDVIGRRYKMEAYHYKDRYINPVIRIAFIHTGLLYLCDRKPESILDPNKADIPFESYLEFEESLEQGVNRTLQKVYGPTSNINPRFTLKYHFKTTDTNRLNYLYIAYIDNESLLRSPDFANGKLWTFQQIEQNLGKGYFCEEFEYEYDFLKETVKIWEEFR